MELQSRHQPGLLSSKGSTGPEGHSHRYWQKARVLCHMDLYMRLFERSLPKYPRESKEEPAAPFMTLNTTMLTMFIS